MKVAWLHSHFLNWMGGTKFVYEIVKRLKKKSDIKMFVELSSPLVNERYSEIGVDVVEISNLSSNSSFYWLLFPLFLRRDLRKLREKVGDFDVIVTSMFPMNWLAIQLGKKTIQYCYEPFAFFHDPEMINGLPFPKRPLVRLLARLYSDYDIEATKKVDQLLTLNETTASWIRNVYSREAVITYAGVDTNFFCKINDPELARKYSGQKIVIHSTDYSPIKGTDLVIRAFKKVRKEVPNARLLITQTLNNERGKRALINLAKELNVHEAIEFLGFVDIEMLPKYYSLADVLVSAGRGTRAGATTMSLPVKEAMACQTAVIRNPATEEDALHGKSGFLIDPEDTEKLAEAMITILRNPDLAKQMGAFGRKTIEEKFSWNKVTEIIWESIVN